MVIWWSIAKTGVRNLSQVQLEEMARHHKMEDARKKEALLTALHSSSRCGDLSWSC